VVEHSPQHPNGEGSKPATTAAKSREKMAEKWYLKLEFFVHDKCVNASLKTLFVPYQCFIVEGLNGF
jgi:hypothetical protein